jgi:GPH family glycoside/pentoside/hexuronide:cation symporter
MYAGAAFCLGILMVVGYFAHFKMTEGYEAIEQPDAPKAVKKKISVREMFASLFKNPQLIILMLADLAKWCVKFVTGAARNLLFPRRDGKSRPHEAVSALHRRGRNHRRIRHALSCQEALIPHVHDHRLFRHGNLPGRHLLRLCQSVALVIGLMTGAQFFYGIAFAASPALYADTVVYSTYKTGADASGWIMGLQNLPLKIAIFLRGVDSGNLPRRRRLEEPAWCSRVRPDRA